MGYQITDIENVMIFSNTRTRDLKLWFLLPLRKPVKLFLGTQIAGFSLSSNFPPKNQMLWTGRMNRGQRYMHYKSMASVWSPTMHAPPPPEPLDVALLASAVQGPSRPHAQAFGFPKHFRKLGRALLPLKKKRKLNVLSNNYNSRLLKMLPR